LHLRFITKNQQANLGRSQQFMCMFVQGTMPMLGTHLKPAEV